jgi:hypothetical protein
MDDRIHVVLTLGEEGQGVLAIHLCACSQKMETGLRGGAWWIAVASRAWK